MMKKITFIFLYSVLLYSLVPAISIAQKPQLVKVSTDSETQPVSSSDDAADDPAIWVHPNDPGRSLIIGTNKKSGLSVYELSGKLLHEYPLGRINNVDVRYGFRLGERKVDIVAGSNRSDSGIVVLAVNPLNGALENILERPLKTGLSEVYGFCLYHDIHEDNYYAFVNGTDGKVEQWQLKASHGNKVNAILVRNFSLKTQTEGCVADDETGYLYIGEEDRGIWKVKASPAEPAVPVLLDSVGNGHLKADVEGLAIFYGQNGTGYLIASSQGNNTYAIYRREGTNEYVGSFKLTKGNTSDGTSDTDGIDVTSCNLGSAYPHGLFVAQDGSNRDGRKKMNQNFKMVSWQKIAREFQPPLDTGDFCPKTIRP